MPPAAMIFIRFWPLLLLPQNAGATCPPTSYSISNVPITVDANTGAPSAYTSASAYCTDKLNGGSAYWTWNLGVCRSNSGSGNSCPCSANSPSASNPIACRCHMEGDDNVNFCYGSPGACAVCAAGQYLLGCGCVHCDRTQYGAAAYDKSLYNFELNDCDNDPWVCGKGSCFPCPIGHECAGLTVQPQPCAGDTYTSEKGGARCIPCQCQPGEFVSNKASSATPCGGAVGMAGLCLPCDPCSEASAEGIPAIAGPFQRCPTRNLNYGRSAAYVAGASLRNTCLLCKSCTVPNTYSLVRDIDNFCYVDRAGMECKDYYYDNSGNPSTDASARQPQAFYADQLMTTLSPTVKTGVMPFVFGLQRNRGIQHKPGRPSSQSNEQVGHWATLPFYSVCPAALQMPHATYYTATDTEATRIRTLLSAETSWAYDCSPHFTSRCDAGHMAVISQWSDIAGLDFVASCDRCPDNSGGGGGRDTSCACAPGFATASKIRGGLSLGLRLVMASSNACLRCRTEVLIQSPQLTMQQEAILCAADGTVRRATGLQIVNAAGTAFDACADAEYALPNRLQCGTCPAGTRTEADPAGQYWKCTACDPYTKHQFQNRAGQPECAAKRTSCPAGQQLAINNRADADDDCVSCVDDCLGLDQIKVMFANRTVGADTCNSNGATYYGCFNMEQGVRASFPLNSRIEYVSATNDIGDAHIEVDMCRNDWLANHSDWVPYPPSQDKAGKQCYFACKYGLNPTVALQFQEATDSYVRRNRADLIPFLPSLLDGAAADNSPPFTASGPKLSIQKAMTYGYDPSALTPSPYSDWIVLLSLPVDPTCTDCLTTRVNNTFLLVDGDAPPPPNLCLAPEASNSLSSRCEKGFARSPQPPPECAMLARTHMYRTSALAQSAAASYFVACVGADASATTCPDATCRADDATLSHFEVPCAYHCLTERHNEALALMQVQTPGSLWFVRVGWVQAKLQGRFWRGKNWNPYQHPESGCDPITCAAGTFKYDLAQHQRDALESPDIAPLIVNAPDALPYACVPCDELESFCHSAYAPARYPNLARCTLKYNGSAAEITAMDVCDPCDARKDHATLIDPIESTPFATGPMRIDWWNARASAMAYSTFFTQDTERWSKITCLYKCDAGYTSNNNVATYDTTPCVRCGTSDAGESCQSNTAVYIDQGSVSKSLGQCGYPDGNYIPFQPKCNPCSDAKTSIDYTFASTAAPADNQGGCLAKCLPAFHTMLLDGSEATTFQPYGTIARCQPCMPTDARPCNGTCQAGQYHIPSNDTCRQCSVAPCTTPGFYREACSGLTANDSQCLPCGDAYLFNAAPPAATALLLADIQNQANLTTRRWVSAGGVSARPGGCMLACVNNFVWLRASTGRSPFSSPTALLLNLTDDMVCIPCGSAFITSGLASPPPGTVWPALYSVWNSTNTTAGTIPPGRAGSALASMRGLPGACNFCPFGHDTLNYGSDLMCETMPGHTTVDQGPSGFAHTVSVSQDTLGGNDLPAQNTDFGFRRRLLQQAATTSRIKTIRVRVQPVISAVYTYFQCCTENSETHAQNCKSMNIRDWEDKKTVTGARYGSDFCDTSALVVPATNRRRLFATQVPVDTCFSGNYKEGRGAGACHTCPYGSSTRSDTATSLADCACLPGFRANRHPLTRALLGCIECGWNHSRSPFQQDDSACAPCPPNTHTPTSSSAFCYCGAGSYLVGSACLPCEPGFYCAVDNNKTACPDHSTSPAAASTRGECRCLAPLYYGDLSNASASCVYNKPGLNCTATPGDAICPCAQGWKRGAGDSCVSSCRPGEYAVLGPSQSILRCVPCPPDTYTATNDTVYIPLLPLGRQCAPCPPNRHTAGAGTPSADGCTCLGVANTSTTCQLCARNQYFEPSAAGCLGCPPGTASPTASVGLSACLCPQGYRAMLLANTGAGGGLRCEPCPKGFYSNSASMSCTACAKGLTTLAPGATSRMQCTEG